MARDPKTERQKAADAERIQRQDSGWREYLDMLGNVVTMNEKGAQLPGFATGLQQNMNTALEEGAQRYGDAAAPEADRFRHVMGMRRSAMDPSVGGIGAFVGGLGHEFNNLRRSILGGDVRQLGSPASRLGLMQILQNSADDVVNNFVGILSAYKNPELLTEEQLLSLLESARMPVDLRRGDPSAVMVPHEPEEQLGE